MDERLKFVARLLEGEKMAVLCREFDISRKTGYKIFSRYKDCGLEGLTDRSRRRFRPLRPNELWCADYKGEFMLADKRYCHPLTITDSASRYLLSCEALSSTKAQYAFTVFERVFKDFGLPQAIRTDNVLRTEARTIASKIHPERGSQMTSHLSQLPRVARLPCGLPQR